MAVRVRAMQTEDLDSVYAIEIIAHRTPWGRQIISDCMLVGYDCRVLETAEQPQIVSFIICRYHDKLCHVLNLCVAPTHQNKGFGRYLLQQVIDSLAGTPIVALILEVRPSNAVALHLYQQMGFQELQVKKEYYHDANGVEDAIELIKNISE